MKKITTKTLVTLALLVAIEIVLARVFSIEITGSKDRIGFGFVPVAMASAMFGPLLGGFTGLVADIIRAILFPTGAFNFLFSISAMLRGILYGIVLYNKPKSVWRTTSVTLIICIFVNVLLNSYWCFISYKMNFQATAITKLPIALVNAAVQIVSLMLIWKALWSKIHNKE